MRGVVGSLSGAGGKVHHAAVPAPLEGNLGMHCHCGLLLGLRWRRGWTSAAVQRPRLEVCRSMQQLPAASVLIKLPKMEIGALMQ